MLYIRRPCFPLSACKRKWKLWASLKSDIGYVSSVLATPGLKARCEVTVKQKQAACSSWNFQSWFKKKNKAAHNGCRGKYSFVTRHLQTHMNINVRICLNMFSMLLHLTVLWLYSEGKQQALWSPGIPLPVCWSLGCDVLDEPFSLTLHLASFGGSVLETTSPSPQPNRHVILIDLITLPPP